MRIIDRYLLRQFLKSFLICFSESHGTLYRFPRLHQPGRLYEARGKGGRPGSGNASLLRLSVDYVLRTHLTALLTLVAAMFTVTWLQRYNELTAPMWPVFPGFAW